MLAAAVTVLALGFLVGYVLIRGVPNLNADMFSLAYTSDNQSMLPAILNTMHDDAAGAAGGRSVRHLRRPFIWRNTRKREAKSSRVIRVTTETLSGHSLDRLRPVRHAVLFVASCSWGYSMLAGALTLAIMILPLIMRTTEEALLSVPDIVPRGQFRPGRGAAAQRCRISCCPRPYRAFCRALSWPSAALSARRRR